MPSNLDELNGGLPTPPDPPAVTDEALRYGNAFIGVFGTEGSPVSYGDFIRRVGLVQSAITVAGDTVDVGPGVVIAVQATVASSTGVKAIRVEGAPAAGEVRVTPQADGTQRLTFNAGDAVTTAAIYLLAIPAAIVSFLDATATPP